jgi:hypothetical protein
MYMKKYRNAVAVILLSGILLLTACGSDLLQMSNNHLTDYGWSYSAPRRDGSQSRVVTLTAEQLEAFRVDSSTESGTVTLTITQGTNERVVNLLGGFNDYVDLSGFSPGEIQLHLNFNSTREFNVEISW